MKADAAQETRTSRNLALLVIWRLALYLSSIAALLFLGSGRTDWAAAWVYLALSLSSMTIHLVVVAKLHPGLIEERAHIKEDAKSWDKRLVFALLVGQFVALLVAALDRRFGWSPEPNVTLQVAGTLLFVAGFALAEWAVVSNRFYSGVVRIQRDRGHVVVSTGPYRHIRHPGYVGGLLAMVGLPLLLGSWTMLIAATLPMGVSVLRTTREDRTLREELEGYEEYTGRVRYRLIPGLW